MNKKIRQRTLMLGMILTLFFFVIFVRLYWIQVVKAPFLLGEAEKVWATAKTLPAKRGTIYDRNGHVLAEMGIAYTVAVNPKIIEEDGVEREVVRGLSAILNKPELEIEDRVTMKREDGSHYTQVEIRSEGWKIDREKADEVMLLAERIALQLGEKPERWKGIFLIEETKRYYPKGLLASQLLGYLNKDNESQFGLELFFNDILEGAPGSIRYDKDRFGRKLPDSKVTYVTPEDGHDIVLTIDQNIQHYLERAMEEQFNQYKPLSMTGIVLNPKTMDVLAMANLPTYDPNEYWNFSSTAVFNNHAIRSVYEPGSTFKIVTLAAAVAEGLFDPEAKFQSGRISIPGSRPVHDHNTVGWGEISYLEGLQRSSNVAFVKLGYEMLGAEKLKEYIDSFGFGTKTEVDLPGEEAGIVQFKWDREVASATFGQGGVLATPLQQAVAYATVANGGKLMKPHVIKEIVDKQTGDVIEERKPEVIREVLSTEAAKQVSEYLETVITGEFGTGRDAKVNGYRVAAKTGTSQKVINGQYSNERYVISFVGYAPVEDPQVVVAIFADDPNLGGDYRLGSPVVIPAFKETMGQTLRYLGIPPTVSEDETELEQTEKKLVKIPNWIEETPSNALIEAQNLGLTVEVLGSGNKIAKQFPAAGTEISKISKVYVVLNDTENSSSVIPDLKGLSMRDVLELGALLDIELSIEGEGYVYTQEEVRTQSGKTKLKLTLLPLPSWPEPLFDEEGIKESEEIEE